MNIVAEDPRSIKPEYKTYSDLFIQRNPRYAVKVPGRSWHSKNKPLVDRPVLAHLAGQYAIASLGKWYPEFAIIDLDDRSLKDAEEIRGLLNLNNNNSMLFSSESANSYHLFLRPEFREKPPTIKLLGEVFKDFAASNGVEIYPSANHCVRLPFGPNQRPLDPEYLNVNSWQDKLFWFQKLNPFDLKNVHGQQLAFNFSLSKRLEVPSVYSEGYNLLQNGLQAPGSRHDCQWRVIYFLWRQNIPDSTAAAMTFKWICTKHNGFSEDIIRHPEDVKKEIQRQVDHIYSTYEVSKVYPDSTHNLHNGFITRPDLELVVKLAKGSLPRMRFLFNLVKFYYPRRHRAFVNLHSDKLIEWSSSAYVERLQELEEQGILDRGEKYSTGRFSKSISLKWPWKDSSNAVLYDGRSVDTFEDSVRMIFKPGDFRTMLEESGASQSGTYKTVKGIWGNSTI